MLYISTYFLAIISLGWLLEPLHSQDALQNSTKEETQAVMKKLQGTWYHLSRHEKGKEVAGEDKEILWVVRDDLFISKQGQQVGSLGKMKLVDIKSVPMKIDIEITDGANEGKTVLAVFSVDGETFRYCGCIDERPASLATSEKDRNYTYCSTFKLMKR
jgi:uncharacterized protein (TIGR03067 family)